MTANTQFEYEAAYKRYLNVCIDQDLSEVSTWENSDHR